MSSFGESCKSYVQKKSLERNASLELLIYTRRLDAITTIIVGLRIFVFIQEREKCKNVKNECYVQKYTENAIFVIMSIGDNKFLLKLSIINCISKNMKLRKNLQFNDDRYFEFNK